MKNIILVLVIILSATTFTQAQKINKERKKFREDKGVTYEKEFGVDIRPHTNGFAIAGNYGIIKTYYKTQVFQFEITELRHPREVRQSFDFFNTPLGNTSRSFVFGKQNSFYALHLGYGGKRYFSEKANRKGVAIGMTYSIGPSLGITKPYYLQLRRFEQNPIDYSVVNEKYSPENASEFLNINSIFGGAGFSYGLDELSVMPGGHAKIGLHLDWGAFDEFIKAIEAGITVDVYPKKIALMVTEDNPSIFLNFYIAVQLGKRW